jgi:hypothetical protein
MENKQRPRSRFFRIAVMAISGIAALGGVVMLLWNWLIPSLFVGAQPLGYFQALGILLLSKILFGGFRGDFRGRRDAWRERVENMTAEERERFKLRLREPWGWGCGSAPNPDDGNENSQRSTEQKSI